MKLLVTGGAGYVGSHCCKAFAEAGWDVTVFDNLSRGWREFVQFGEFYEGDIMNPDDLADAIAKVKPDAVAHFAAFAYVGESVTDPGLYYRNNTQGTLNILEAMLTKIVGLLQQTDNPNKNVTNYLICTLYVQCTYSDGKKYE